MRCQDPSLGIHSEVLLHSRGIGGGHNVAGPSGPPPAAPSQRVAVTDVGVPVRSPSLSTHGTGCLHPPDPGVCTLLRKAALPPMFCIPCGAVGRTAISRHSLLVYITATVGKFDPGLNIRQF